MVSYTAIFKVITYTAILKILHNPVVLLQMTCGSGQFHYEFHSMVYFLSSRTGLDCHCMKTLDMI